MDIDQRLERLTERHEALTQSVELFVASTRENLDRLERVAEENDKRLAGRMADLMDTMNRIGNIIISHEDRLDDVEHRLDDIEGKS
jgi:ferritin-like metal-binding protein YciE